MGADAGEMVDSDTVAREIRQLQKINKNLASSLKKLGGRNDTHKLRNNINNKKNDGRTLTESIAGALKQLKSDPYSDKRATQKMDQQYQAEAQKLHKTIKKI